MNESLILLLGQTPEDPIRWAFVAEREIHSADMAANADALSALAGQAARARAVVAVLPGEHAAMRAIPAPPRSQAKFRAAAGFLLEDDLAENLEHMHLAVLRLESGAGLALAVKKSLMEAWRAAFSEAGIFPDIMVPDYALIPLRSDQATLVFEPKRIFGGIGYQGFAAERPLADAIVRELLKDETIEAVAAFGDHDAERIDFGDKPHEWCGLSDDASLFYLYAHSLSNEAVPNFIQGDYRKRKDWGAVVGPWRRAAMLAAACAIGLFATVIADAARSGRIADRLNEQAEELHRTAFPEYANIDPRAHARSILSAQTGGLDFLPLSTQFADSLAENDNIQVDRIRYNANRGEFSINLRFSDINDLEALKRALADRGVSAEEAGGVRRSGGFYVGELKVGQS